MGIYPSAFYLFAHRCRAQFVETCLMILMVDVYAYITYTWEYVFFHEVRYSDGTILSARHLL